MIFSQIANIIFKDLLNDMFDVDFTEPIKDIAWKERERAFCDKNDFIIFTQSIRDHYRKDEFQIMEEKRQAMEAILDAQEEESEGDKQHPGEKDKDKHDDEDDYDDEDWEDVRKLQDEEEENPDMSAFGVIRPGKKEGEFQTRKDINLMLSLIGEKI
eukprot:CAMPEP_0170486498 /NCGR_PEP_ID=MMETSP0208-20121228/5498_1 /TAXON_ID=197538 /ORGANISM="Strombidium inclinatum, Strain S3" /LENGTH=156 /DNA_ID=CAMNT_0010760455 /DNA_START=1757 /DNA_END=2227 /DNA_ORIENTATION=-